MKATWKVQVKVFKWWTTNTYSGSDTVTLCQKAMKTMQNKPIFLKRLEWKVINEND
jgi:hypothetical protein